MRTNLLKNVVNFLKITWRGARLHKNASNITKMHQISINQSISKTFSDRAPIFTPGAEFCTDHATPTFSIGFSARIGKIGGFPEAKSFFSDYFVREAENQKTKPFRLCGFSRRSISYIYVGGFHLRRPIFK